MERRRQRCKPIEPFRSADSHQDEGEGPSQDENDGQQVQNLGKISSGR